MDRLSAKAVSFIIESIVSSDPVLRNFRDPSRLYHAYEHILLNAYKKGILRDRI